MLIQAEPPFAITRDADGAQHAVKENIQLTVTPDCGDATVNHRVGEKPHAGETSRWLHVDLENHGLHVFVSGTHVVVTGRDYLPTFDLDTPDSLMAEALRLMKAGKDEKGRYVVDTENNRRILKLLFESVERTEKNRLLAWVRHAIARLAE